MSILKNYVIPTLVGSIAGAITIWAFDSFEKQEMKYFFNAFIKCLAPIVVAVVIVNMMNKKKTS